MIVDDDDDDGGSSCFASLSFFLASRSLIMTSLTINAGGDRAWETHSTDTLKKIKQDVTRHR